MKEEIKRTYYKNGKLMYEFPYINGRMSGIYRFYCENGQLGCEASYKNNSQFGIHIWFEY